MQKVEVEEKVEVMERRYTATFRLTNSGKVSFGRRDLALCFYPPKIVAKADRIYETLAFKGKPVPMSANVKLAREIWVTIQKRFIYDGTWKKVDRHSFDWNKITKRLCKDYRLESFRIIPERGGKKPVTEIKITTDTDNIHEHTETVENLYTQLRTKAPHLNIQKSCWYNIAGPCPTDLKSFMV